MLIEPQTLKSTVNLKNKKTTLKKELVYGIQQKIQKKKLNKSPVKKSDFHKSMSPQKKFKRKLIDEISVKTGISLDKIKKKKRVRKLQDSVMIDTQSVATTMFQNKLTHFVQ